jgi:biotin transport system substrate-specific component
VAAKYYDQTFLEVAIIVKSKTLNLALCALFAALTAILSQIALPIGPVPINMAAFAVFCAGTLLGSKLGALSLTVWVGLGASGIPVFSMWRGGLVVLIGPTGGYIVGYIAAAFVTGLITERFNKNNKIYLYFSAMLAGALTYFIMGTMWFMFLSRAGFIEALTVCVVPFIPGDLLKIAATATLTKRIRPVIFMKR